MTTSPSRPTPVRQAFDLPGGRRVEFEFTAPDLFGYEITPTPSFDDRAEALEFLRAYVDARGKFVELVATLTGRTLAVVDELGDGVSAIGQAIAPANRQ
jgi:hypothetical protein